MSSSSNPSVFIPPFLEVDGFLIPCLRCCRDVEYDLTLGSSGFLPFPTRDTFDPLFFPLTLSDYPSPLFFRRPLPAGSEEDSEVIDYRRESRETPPFFLRGALITVLFCEFLVSSIKKSLLFVEGSFAIRGRLPSSGFSPESIKARDRTELPSEYPSSSVVGFFPFLLSSGVFFEGCSLSVRLSTPPPPLVFPPIEKIHLRYALGEFLSMKSFQSGKLFPSPSPRSELFCEVLRSPDERSILTEM